MLKACILLSILLAGCSNDYREYSFPVIPPELKDCKFYHVENKEGKSLEVVRCPNSNTASSYRSGKTTRNIIVIDGVEYEAKPKENRSESNSVP